MKSVVATIAAALILVAIGVIAILFGAADDAPGLVALGIVVIVVAVALGVRTARQSAR